MPIVENVARPLTPFPFYIRAEPCVAEMRRGHAHMMSAQGGGRGRYIQNTITGSRHTYLLTDITVCGHRMAHRKWKETKQQPSMLPDPELSFFPFPVGHPMSADCTGAKVNGQSKWRYILFPQPWREGGTPKEDAVRKLSKVGCVRIQTGEVKKSKKIADIICTWPLSGLPCLPFSLFALRAH